MASLADSGPNNRGAPVGNSKQKFDAPPPLTNPLAHAYSSTPSGERSILWHQPWEWRECGFHVGRISGDFEKVDPTPQGLAQWDSGVFVAGNAESGWLERSILGCPGRGGVGLGVFGEIFSGPIVTAGNCLEAPTALSQYFDQDFTQTVTETNKTFKERLEILAEGIRQAGFGARIPKATFYLWVNVGMDGAEFLRKLLAFGVAATPGEAFGPNGKNYVRFSVTQPTTKTRTLIQTSPDSPFARFNHCGNLRTWLESHGQSYMCALIRY